MRKFGIAIATCVVAAGIGFGVSGQADAGTTLLQTVTKSEHIVSARCFTYAQTTITYYHWSSKTGWTKYAAPKKTVTTGETCH